MRANVLFVPFNNDPTIKKFVNHTTFIHSMIGIRYSIIAIFSLLSGTIASAQDIGPDKRIIANEDSCSTEAIQSAIDACILLVQSAEANDTTGLRMAKEALKESQISPDSSICLPFNENRVSLKGHMVFNENFADILANGYKEEAYENADIINKLPDHRGIPMMKGKITTKTFLIPANEKCACSLSSRNRQELAVVAEPGGLVTTRIHAVNEEKGIDEWHNDTTDVAKGRNCRKSAFTLPPEPSSHITIEIQNCTNKNISVVVISN